jgi:hypothetical protein
LADTSRYGTSRLATLQTAPSPLAICIRCITKFGLGDPLELQPDFKLLSVSFSPIWLEDDNRFASTWSGSNLGKYQRLKLIPLVPLPLFTNELLGLYLIDIRIPRYFPYPRSLTSISTTDWNPPEPPTRVLRSQSQSSESSKVSTPCRTWYWMM